MKFRTGKMDIVVNTSMTPPHWAMLERQLINAQAEAIRHGIARALVVFDESLKTSLRRQGLITRDSRIKESKKYGLKRARRAPQYTKR